MTKSCPQCNRSIAVKTLDTCLYCGADLPPELCLSAEEKQQVKQKRAKYSAWRQRRRALFGLDVKGSSFGDGSGGSE